jgi:hypothetical protein
MGGRGAGKTRAGSEWIRAVAARDPHLVADSGGRIALVGETIADARAVMIEGESGLLAVHGRRQRPDWNPSKREITWGNGAIGRVFSANDPDGLRGSQFGAAWCDELGCPAVAMGANQPNVFPDAKSSEAALPWFSTGARADLVQNRFLAAHLDYWNPVTAGLAPDRNPVSPVYGGPMVETANIFPWAWDARPFPWFPASADLWSDGANWQIGHWLNGRIGGCPVGELISAICADFGIAAIDARADGFCDGYVVPGPMPARGAIAPLAAVFDVQYSEEGATRQFLSRAYARRGILMPADFAEVGENPLLRRDRGQESEIPHELDIGHGELFGGYEMTRSRSLRVGAAGRRAASMDLPIVLPSPVAEGLAESRLRDLWVGRESIELSLSRRHLALAVGDRVRIEDGANLLDWRVEAIEDAEARQLRLRAIAGIEDLARPAASVPALALTVAANGAPRFLAMNLPLAPADASARIYCAASAAPWARRYGIWSSPADYGFAYRGIVTVPAVMGELTAPLASGPEGRFDRANHIEIRLYSGALSSQPELLALNGANAAAVRCANGEWEILQFRDAELTIAGTWRLSNLLRGQIGTDPAMRSGAPAGSPLVLLDASVIPVALAPLESGLGLNWRCGPASDPVAGGSFTQVSHVHATLSQRPLSPVHLAARRTHSGDVTLAWIRRSRIDADTWDAPEVPLGEPAEAWQVAILRSSGETARIFSVASPAAEYTAVEQAADFGAPPASIRFSVAQIGANGAPGAAREATISLS